MARITKVDGSSSVPGQRDAKKDQENRERQERIAAIPGMEQATRDPSTDVPSLFSPKKGDEDLFGPNYGRQRIRLHKRDEVNPYADADDARLGWDPRAKTLALLAVATLLCFVVAAILPTNILSIESHPAGISPAVFLDEVKMQFLGVLAFFTGQETMFTAYLWEVVAALLAGAAMGLSGGVYQGALKNALASPSTLGVTSGGSLGLIIYALFVYGHGYSYEQAAYIEGVASMSLSEWFFDTFGMFLSSLAGCCLVVLVLMVIAMIAGRGHVSNISLVIAGQVLTAVVGVVVSTIQYYLIYVAGNTALAELVEQASSVTFNGVYTAVTVFAFAVPLLACMAVVFALSSKLNLLAFSDEEARSMGLSTARTRNVMVAACTIMTALVISFTGPIGFVGFMVPHIARRIMGPEFRFLLPATALLGGILVMAVHAVASLGISWFSVGATGTFTSLVGCIFFLIVALSSRGDKRAEWY